MRTDQAADASLRRGDSDRLYTMVRDGLLPSLDLEDVVRAREQWWITIGEAAPSWG